MLCPIIMIAMAPQAVQLHAGITLERSARVVKRVYNIASSDDGGSSGAVTIKGDNLVLDFGGATLRGTPPETEPDERAGTGVVVSGRNVTIRNLRAHGYKIGLIARDSLGLKLEGCDFSYNWKQRLKSTPEREDLSDWMSYHQNEKDEWLRYGAGIYLRGCDRFEVTKTKIHGGQNGLLLTQCDNGLVWNCDFSFLSSLGIGMYRSSGNRIMHNKIDWCVRGFSYGVYNRGQDSAGILVYEQSSRNTFAYNSVTHGGDGFFLWAGQTTMDTGRGGCNDNLLFGNDFSHAPTNGIEATFSRNLFVNNLILECWHGIWGGYSYDSKVIANVFGHNAEAIAWEHGQHNSIIGNSFNRDHEGIVIWSNPTQDPNWIYPKKRDTASRDWTIASNQFANEFAAAIRLRRTAQVRVSRNSFANNGTVIKQEEGVAGLELDRNMVKEGTPLPPQSALNQGDITDYKERFETIARVWNPLRKPPPSLRNKAAMPHRVQPLPGGQVPFLRQGAKRGWRYMIVDEWGPYDFKRPLVWPRGRTESGVQIFEILGPPGRVYLGKGGELVSGIKSARIGGTVGIANDFDVPATIEVASPRGRSGNLDLEFTYVGSETVDHRGVVTPKGKAVKFGYTRFFAPIDWTVRWYAWDRTAVSDPRAAMPDPERLLSRTQLREPLKEEKTDRLDYAWGGSPGAPVPADHFITLADGALDIPAGEYLLEVTTDDGVRVWVDDRLVIDSWKYQGPTVYTSPLSLGGKHRIRVEHYEIDGYATLRLNLKPRR